MWVKYEITKDSFLNEIWGEAKQTVENLINEGISSEQIFDYYEEMYSDNEDNPVDITNINDDLAYNADAIYQFFGVDPYGEIANSKKSIKSGVDNGNYTAEYEDEVDKALDKVEDPNNNIYVGYNFDAESFYINVTQINETTGNSKTWFFVANFKEKVMYEVEPYGYDLGSFETADQIYEKIKRVLNGDTSMLKNR